METTKHRNILIFSMSTFSRDEEVVYEIPFLQDSIHDTPTEDSQLTGICKHTNEGVVRYLSEKLARKGERLDAIYAFTTNKVETEQVKFKTNNRFIEMALTHEELFNTRIQDLGLKVIGIHLEDEQELEQAYLDLANMLETIDKELASGDAATTTIHFDMSGGRRHATALMLTLINLLKYRNANIGEILYSELDFNRAKKDECNRSIGKIYDAKALIRMFQLVGGTEEFSTFGSVEQILQFFNRKPHTTEAQTLDNQKEPLSKELNALLESMQTLSNMFKLSCSFDVMKTALATLQKDIGQFKASIEVGKSSPKEIFFARLLPIVEREYGLLLKGSQELEEIDLIKWCLDKDMLQQAITYYTEWIPSYVGTRKITVDEKILEECKVHMAAYSDAYIYLFRSFEDSAAPSKVINNIEAFNETSNILNIIPVFDTIKDSNKKFDLEDFLKKLNIDLPFTKFLQNSLKIISTSQTKERFTNEVFKLPKNDPLRIIIASIEDTIKMKQDKKDAVGRTIKSKVIAYFNKERQKNIISSYDEQEALQDIFIDAIKNYLKKASNYYKALAEHQVDASVYTPLTIEPIENVKNKLGLTCLVDQSPKRNMEEDVETKAQRREMQMDSLLRRGKISLKEPLTKEALVSFVGDYFRHVNTWRNLMNHANYKDYYSMDGTSIRKAILDNLSRIQ